MVQRPPIRRFKNIRVVEIIIPDPESGVGFIAPNIRQQVIPLKYRVMVQQVRGGPKGINDVYHATTKVVKHIPSATKRAVNVTSFLGRDFIFESNYAPSDLAEVGNQSVAPTELDSWVPDIDTVIDRFADRVFQPPSLLNILAELDDIPRMMQSALSGLRASRTRRGRRRLTRQAYIRNGVVVNPPLPWLSSAVLSVNLGLLPSYGDFVSIFNRIQNGLREYQELRERLGNEGLRIVMTKKVDYSKYVSSTAVNYTGVHTKIYGATAVANLQSADPNDTWYGVGLNWDLQTLWDATPFSFLFDYVIPIGDVLRRARAFSDVSIRDPWITNVYESTASRDLGAFGYQELLSPGSIEFDCKVYTRYSSYWDHPDQISVRDVGLPSPRAWSNLLAFAQQILQGVVRG